MNSSLPFVSILLITMNHEEFIEEACRSVVNQTYLNIEVIFLDNCSTDRTFEKGKSILENSGLSVKYIKNESSFGVSKNLNTMLSHTSAEYTAILSGDDWWEKNLIEEKIKFIQQESVDFVFSDGYKFIQKDKQIIPAYPEKQKKEIMGSLDIFFQKNVTGNKMVNVGTFIKTNLLLQHPFDESIHTEDWDMNLRMTYNGYRPGFIDKKLFYYRILSSSLSRKWEIMQDSYERVTAKYIEYINSNPKLSKELSLTALHFKYEILRANCEDENQLNRIKKEYLTEKYKIKYKHPILFFKLLTI